MKYYTCANTADGIVDFTDDNIFDIKNKIVLKGENPFLRSFILNFSLDKKKEYEVILCVGSRDTTDGVILRDESTAVVKDCVDAKKTIDLDHIFGTPEISVEVSSLYNGMFEHYSHAKDIHDRWEEIYINNMNIERLNQYCEGIIDKLVKKKSLEGFSKTYKRFFGTVTQDETVNYIDNITENISERFFIKGRPGTGKSTFLKKLSAALKKNGFDVEEYYCSFDKNSLDMIVSRELSFSVFDSTPPHEKFPQRENDKILDFYAESGLTGTDEKYEKELSFIKSAYNFKINEGKKLFSKALELENKAYNKKFMQADKYKLREIAECIWN